MSNMPASYTYSMLGYGYPPAYLQLPPGYSQQQLASILGAQNMASLGAQNLASLGAQNLASLGAQNWAAAAPGGCVQNLGGSGQVYVTSGGSGQAFGGHSGSGQMLRAPGGYSLGAMPSLVSGQAAGQSVRLSMKNGEKETRESPGLPAAAAVQQEVGGGEGGEEYLQELIKERDAIETSSSSSLSKTHILRLLNKGKYSTVGYSIETIAPPAASPRPIFSGLSIKVNILEIP